MSHQTFTFSLTDGDIVFAICAFVVSFAIGYVIRKAVKKQRA